nr:MAG TPA: hypothetical protein [Caudoviricetes sp.]
MNPIIISYLRPNIINNLIDIFEYVISVHVSCFRKLVVS